MEKAILIRYISGEATEGEKAEVIRWIDSDAENMREFLSLRKLYDITLWQDTPASSRISSGFKVFRNPALKRIVIETMKIAAVFLLGFLIFSILNNKESKSTMAVQTIFVPAGQRAEITLADGSQVWLNANTRFTFPGIFDDGKREVTLDGEGYFVITRNESQPFIVRTGNYDIKVLGTEFNVLAYACKKEFEVSLLKGSVEILEQGNDGSIILEPDHRLFLKDNQLVTAEIKHTNYFLWKDGIISFDDEPFTSLVKKLELYFDLTIKVQNEKILGYRCTGKFRSKDGVEHILKVLQLSNKFSYKIDEKENIITIN